MRVPSRPNPTPQGGVRDVKRTDVKQTDVKQADVRQARPADRAGRFEGTTTNAVYAKSALLQTGAPLPATRKGGLFALYVARSNGASAREPSASPLVDRLFPEAGASAPTGAPTRARLQDIESAPLFGTLSAEHQEKLKLIFQVASPSGRAALARLMHKELNGAPVLLDKSAPGKTLIDELDALGRAFMSQVRLTGVAGEDVMDDMLVHVDDPSTVVQSNRGTCTATSLQFQATRSAPAEVCRVLVGLAKDEPVTLRSGQTLRPCKDGQQLDSASDRSHASRLFQSAFMDFMSPPGHRYSNQADRYVDVRTGRVADKLSGATRPENLAAPLAAFFGEEVTTVIASDGDRDKEAKALQLLEEKGNDKTLVALYWKKSLFSGSGHMVAFDEVKDGRVYFRDPNGSVLASGMSRFLTGVRVEDEKTGLKSIDVDTFKERVLGVYIPEGR